MKLTTFLLPTLALAAKQETWSIHPARLVEPISDMTAVVSGDSIYIIGGCNHEKGNERIPNTTDFYCLSATNTTQTFHPSTGKIQKLPDAPHVRYRHAAVAIGDRIWVMGGRNDQEDALVSTIDIFDTRSDTWMTTPQLTLPDVTSDLAAFVLGGFIYVTAGYLDKPESNEWYLAQKRTIRIDPAASLTSGTLVYEIVDSLNEARGDAHVGTANGKAYIVGGFTHVDNYCNPLASVEAFDGTSWQTQAPITYKRGDKAVVGVGDKIYVLGGESKTDCTSDPSQRTRPTTEVEVLDTNTGVWSEEIADIPDDHFRFPAVAVGRTIYTFGGQGYYDSDCDCFPPRDTILLYTVGDETIEEESSGSSKNQTLWIIVGAAGVGLVAILALWSILSGKKNMSEVVVTDHGKDLEQEMS